MEAILSKATKLLATDWRAQIAAAVLLLIIIYLLYKGTRFMSMDTLIKNTAKSEGMPSNMQALLVAQAKHETANFTSNAYRKNKNLYGYKYVSGAGLQLAKGITSSEGNAYASYASYENSVREVCRWIKKRQKEGIFPADLSGLTAATYAQYLKAGKGRDYYGDPVAVYTRGLTHYLA